MGIQVIAEEFPNPILAREGYWLPLVKKLMADKNTILIGHSSGAVASMRYSEKNKIMGSVLVGACHTDLGLAEEDVSGYYSKPWDRKAIKQNQKFIVQFASIDDTFISVEEARYIHEHLNTEYYEYTNEGHFGHGNAPKLEFPKIVEKIRQKLIRKI